MTGALERMWAREREGMVMGEWVGEEWRGELGRGLEWARKGGRRWMGRVWDRVVSAYSASVHWPHGASLEAHHGDGRGTWGGAVETAFICGHGVGPRLASRMEGA